MRSLSIASLLLATLAFSACKPDMLPGTAVEDTKENRAVVDFLEEYREAVETRSAAQVLTLVADDYFEDGGTSDQADDYGAEKLQRDLDKAFEHAKAIHLEVFVQNVEYDEEKGLWNVDYRYRERALLAFEAGEKWVTHTDVNRLVLRSRDEDSDDTENGFLIVSGL